MHMRNHFSVKNLFISSFFERSLISDSSNLSVLVNHDLIPELFRDNQSVRIVVVEPFDPTFISRVSGKYFC